jgi:hypothetical protein
MKNLGQPGKTVVQTRIYSGWLLRHMQNIPFNLQLPAKRGRVPISFDSHRAMT